MINSKTIKMAFVLISASFSMSAQLNTLGSTYDPCDSGPTVFFPWHIGGNTLLQNAPSGAPPNWQPLPMDIGTCNNESFVLKANNIRSVFVTGAGKIGINNSSPQAALDIKNQTLGQQSSFRIYGDLNGNLESTTDVRINFASGKACMFNEGNIGSNTTRMTIKNGNVGIGTILPTTKLQVVDATLAHLNITTTSTNMAKLSVYNSYVGNYLATDQSVGRLGVTNGTTDYHLVNFSKNPVNNAPQVWIGTRKPVGTHADFNFAVDGKIVSTSVFVTANSASNWADYVFEEDYKLPLLSEVEVFYKKNKHLPEIPTTTEVMEHGIDIGSMNALLLKKVEELTLYVVDISKKMESLQKENILLINKIH